jgi:uncharacterized protein YqjF (DUF2071 family)
MQMSFSLKKRPSLSYSKQQHQENGPGGRRMSVARTFLTAEWRKLLMVQYEVPPAVLEPYMPAGLELDLFQGRCYVSLVGFLFDRVRVKGLAIPFHTQFEEVNLRFYVRRPVQDGSSERGVVFVGEFVPRWAIAFVAKQLYEEPYRAMPTRREIVQSGGELHIAYEWKDAARWHRLSAIAGSTTQEMLPGSEEEFITEHYWGYTKRSNGRTSTYQVSHPRWRVYPVQNFEVAADFAALYGERFAFLNSQPASSVLLAEGSPVSVGVGERL